MIPTYFIKIEKIPISPNGKLDIRALGELADKVEVEIESEPPGNEVEEKFVEIWSDILKVKKIGINHDFFELGGNSMSALIFVSEIEKYFNVKISIMEIFKNPIIKDLSKLVIDSEFREYSEEPFLVLKKSKKMPEH